MKRPDNMLLTLSGSPWLKDIFQFWLAYQVFIYFMLLSAIEVKSLLWSCFVKWSGTTQLFHMYKKWEKLI